MNLYKIGDFLFAVKIQGYLDIILNNIYVEYNIGIIK